MRITPGPDYFRDMLNTADTIEPLASRQLSGRIPSTLSTSTTMRDYKVARGAPQDAPVNEALTVARRAGIIRGE